MLNVTSCCFASDSIRGKVPFEKLSSFVLTSGWRLSSSRRQAPPMKIPPACRAFSLRRQPSRRQGPKPFSLPVSESMLTRLSSSLSTSGLACVAWSYKTLFVGPAALAVPFSNSAAAITRLYFFNLREAERAMSAFIVINCIWQKTDNLWPMPPQVEIHTVVTLPPVSLRALVESTHLDVLEGRSRCGKNDAGTTPTGRLTDFFITRCFRCSASTSAINV
jgi:hypothetical protein